jgi:hypothetical protein
VAVVVKGDSAPHLHATPTALLQTFPTIICTVRVSDLTTASRPLGRRSPTSSAPCGVGPTPRCCVDWVDASDAVGAAKLIKTPDEIACIRNAQRLNELAMTDAQAILRPGVRQIDLSAVFLRRVFELGASANGSIRSGR